MSTLSSYKFKDLNLVNEVFIETGTCRGDTLVFAAEAGFKQCHSIEVCPELFQFSLNRIGNNPNVKMHLGSSPDLLRGIIDPELSTTFWLDAHYSGAGREMQDDKIGECPLMKELEIICSFKWAVLPFIIIDDSHMYIPEKWNENVFPVHLFDKSQWPTLNVIQNKLSDYHIFEEDFKLYCIPKEP